MYKLFLSLFSILIFATSCNNDCQDLLDNVTSAKSSYESNPSETSCITYQNALQAYLSSTCEGQPGVNYEIILQTYLDELECEAFSTCSNGVQDADETGVDCGGPVCTPCNTGVSTCTDGIQNGNETGVDCGGPDCSPCSTGGATCSDGIQNGTETGIDCGGSCPPCSSTNAYFITCDINGAPWEGFFGGFISPSLSFGFINAYSSYLNEGQIRMRNFDNCLVTGSYVFSEGGVGSAGDASFSYSPEATGTTPFHYYIPVGNNGSLVITDVNLVDSTITGTFTVSAYDDNFTPYDTISVTNGSFYLPIE